jgi:hypothetical protein
MMTVSPSLVVLRAAAGGKAPASEVLLVPNDPGLCRTIVGIEAPGWIAAECLPGPADGGRNEQRIRLSAIADPGAGERGLHVVRVVFEGGESMEIPIMLLDPAGVSMDQAVGMSMGGKIG